MKIYSELEHAQIESLNADPSTLVEGRVWKNTTSHDVKVQVNGVTEKTTFVDKVQTLTNKTLTAPVIATIVNTGTLTLPTATTTLVGRDTTDTLTNKAIDAEATGNSVTNLKDANIKAGAAIALDKLATTTASRALVSDSAGVITPSTVTATELDSLSGITSNIQAQLTGLASAASGFSTGDVKFTLKAIADSGWIMANDGTVGNASSGGTARANADAEALFTLLWNNVSNAHAAVSGGRGANAAADFAANKTIALTKMLGRSLAVAGLGAVLTQRNLGETTGSEAHVLTTNQMPSHNHGGGNHTHTVPTHSAGEFAGSSPSGVSGSNGSVNTGTSGTIIATEGGGQAFNIMQPTSFLNVMIKL